MLDDLLLFLRIDARGSISAAARDLGLSPATASARLAALERLIGQQLFSRTTRRVALTAGGEAFRPHAELAVQAAEAGLAALGKGGAAPKGQLRITAPASFGRLHLVPHLAAFAAAYPEIKLDLRLSDTVFDLVEGAFDVALRITDQPDLGLVARKLAPDRRVLVAAPSYLARAGMPLVPGDLRHHSCLVLGHNTRWLFRTANGPQAVDVSGVFRTDSGEASREAAIQGLGIAAQATWNAGPALRSGALVPLMPDTPLARAYAIWAVYPETRVVAPKTRAFIDFVATRFTASPYWDQELPV